MRWAVLKVTDGTTVIDLLGGSLNGAGFSLKEWLPRVAVPKGDGVWQDSPLSEGRRPAYRRLGNVVETMTLTISRSTQEMVIADTQALRRLLEQAVQYWFDATGVVDPVWIEARADCETNSRYAYIFDYRTPEDGDPYHGTFTPPSGPVAFDEWELSLERGHWLSDAPGSQTCLLANNLMDGYNYGFNRIDNAGFETLGGGPPDVFASWGENANTGAIAQDAANKYEGTQSARLTAGVLRDTDIYQTVAVPASTTFLLTIHHRRNTAGAPGRYAVYDNSHAAWLIALTTLADEDGWQTFQVQFTTPVGCISIDVILYCADVNGEFVNYDYITLREIVATSFGNTNTCTNDIFSANKANLAQLTDGYTYDDSTGVWGSNILFVAGPSDLLPNPAAVDDCLYLGIDNGALYSGPFSNVIFTMSQVNLGAHVHGTWQYWNGAWTDIPAAQMIDGTDLLGYGPAAATEYTRGLSFVPQDDWAMRTVHNIYGYWIRAHVTAIGAGAPRPQNVTRWLYSQISPALNVLVDGAAVDDESNLGGDLPALIKAQTSFGNLVAYTTEYSSHQILAARSVSRGADFVPWINWSDVQQPTGVNIVGGPTFTDDPKAPTGRCLHLVAAGAGTTTTQIEIDSTLANQYHGSFRLLLRMNTAAASAAVTVRMAYDCPSQRYGPVVSVPGAGKFGDIYDMGRMDIPNTALSSIERLDYIMFYLFVTSTGAGSDVSVYDMALIPVDECAVDFNYDPFSYTMTFSNLAVIDSIYPKKTARGVLRLTTGNVQAALNLVSSGGAQLAPREDQYVYFFGLGDQPVFFGASPSCPYELWRSRFYRVLRFLSMRGAK